MNHQFLHHILMGSIRAVLLEKEMVNTGLSVTIPFHVQTKNSILGGKLIIRRNTNVDTTKKEEKESDLMVIRTQYSYQTSIFKANRNEEPELSLWNVKIPIDKEQRVCHTFVMMMFERSSRFPWLMELFWPAII